MGDRPTWMSIDSADALADALCSLYEERGDAMYDESVSQSVHGVQAAVHGAREAAEPALQLAALLHDIGHLLERGPDADDHPERDLRHEEIAARFLSNWFGPEVTEPIRHHVAAKRYLVSVEPGYAEALSPASIHSLGLQGGPMSPDEVDAFIATPGAADSVRLRRWDDLAKDAAMPTPHFAEFRDLIVSQHRASRRGEDFTADS